MRNVTKQIFKLFAVIFSIMLTANVTAQNIVYEITGVRSTNSIIREHKKDCYVIYNDINGKPTFGYADISTLSYTEASMSGIPTLVINDIEIVEDIVYFCGKIPSFSYVIFGFFNIDSVFFGGGSINYCIMSSLTMTSPYAFNGYTETFTNLLRIEPYVLSSNDVHIFMVGESYYTDPTGIQYPYRCLIDAQYKGSNTLELSTIEDPYGAFYFNDIAATSSYLVAVGDKHGGTGNYMTKFPLPFASSTYYFTGLIPPFYHFWCPDIDYFPIPDARIEVIGKDAFATVCKGFVGGNVGTGTSGITLTTYGSAFSFTDQHLIPNPYNVTEFRDLKFNPTDNNLYYVPEYLLTTSPQYVFCSQILPGYYIGTNLEEPVFATPTICSLDTKKNAKGAFASGFSNTHILNMWNVEVAGSPCAAPAQIPQTNNYFAISSDIFNFYFNNDSPVLNSRQPNINVYLINLICE